MNNPHKGRRGVDRLWHATRNSWRGLMDAYQRESAFRQELWLAIAFAPASVWLGRTWLERAVLLGSLMLVLIVELLNSGIETAVDRISFDHHELARLAKDYASAAVLLSLLLCAGIWLSALWRGLAA